MAAVQFKEWFEQATGETPYGHQTRLAEATVLPSVVAWPTGTGKTQGLVGAWLYQRLNGRAPRRLVYALPMRTLVEQTHDVAHDMLVSLDLQETVALHVLMGGEDTDDWRLDPTADQILVGTIDMLLSRALNRGYAESRFAWPVSFGLLNSDCRWVFDEVQLMGPARTTSAQLDGLRTKLGVIEPCESIWVSATVDRTALTTVDRPELGEVMALNATERKGPLAKRLTAAKRLHSIDLTEAKPAEHATRAAQLALDRHQPATRTLVVLNTVERAQRCIKDLQRLTKHVAEAPRLVLAHSRFRPPERAQAESALRESPGPTGTIVVATQVVEAGVDISSRTLITELAPWSSIVQRLGRCNRAGDEPGGGDVYWLDSGEPGTDKKARGAVAPYESDDLRRTRDALLDLEGESLSPQMLDDMDSVPHETTDDPAVLRRSDIVDLFDTSPDLSGLDIDIAPFIRDDDERNVSVLFRAVGSSPESTLDEPRAERDELVQIPLAQLSERRCWRPDHVNSGWLRTRASDIPPGATVLLAAEDGGYDATIGWDPKSKSAVEPIPLTSEKPVEAVGTDEDSISHTPQPLDDHLAQATNEAAQLCDAIDGLENWRDKIKAAAALHDIGKAHPIFQALMREVIDAEIIKGAPDVLWAKSASRSRGGYSRRYFRHELASALALLAHEQTLGIDRLTTYLVASHHGRARLSIRRAPDEHPPPGLAPDTRYALGVADGDELPAIATPAGSVPATVLDLQPMDPAGDPAWTDIATTLRDDLGPFRLAFLEAIVRIADWRASA